MPNDVQAAILNSPKPEALYGKLEDRILARDQKGASDVYYDLVRQRRPMQEIIGEAVRIHAPYTHVPYHERIDDGYVNFVNNDHCLLSARAATQLAKMVPEDCAALPLAQTIWYIPTGLDIWNQKILKAPGHYARAPGWTPPPGPPPMPEVVWPDQQPEHVHGDREEEVDQGPPDQVGPYGGGHLDHRLAESERVEQRLRAGVEGGGPEHDARRAALAQPVDRCLHQLRTDADAARLLGHGNVVDESGRAAQLFPRQRLQRRPDVTGDGDVALGDEDDVVRRLEHLAEKPRVAALGPFARREEPLPVERVVRSHEHGAEAAERVEVAALGPADVTFRARRDTPRTTSPRRRSPARSGSPTR